MKTLISVFLVVMLTACATQTKPVTLSDGSKGFITTCNGSSNSWGKCYDSAANSCNAGFDIKDKEQFVHDGFVDRKLYFACK